MNGNKDASNGVLTVNELMSDPKWKNYGVVVLWKMDGQWNVDYFTNHKSLLFLLGEERVFWHSTYKRDQLLIII